MSKGRAGRQVGDLRRMRIGEISFRIKAGCERRCGAGIDVCLKHEDGAAAREIPGTDRPPSHSCSCPGGLAEDDGRLARCFGHTRRARTARYVTSLRAYAQKDGVSDEVGEQ